MTTTSEKDKTPLILIVEDDKDLAHLNMRLLKRQGYDALVAYNAEQARAVVRENPPDLFVFDVTLPDGSGFSLCREFRKDTHAPVLFLTGKSETKDKITGLGAGGDYYLTKPYDRDEFLAVIQTLLRREEQTRKKINEAFVIERGSVILSLSEYKAYVDGEDAELTIKEFAILKMLMQNEGKELSAETLYESVWGTTMNNDANALRLQMSRLKKKLSAGKANGFAIVTSYAGGYSFTVTETKENE